MESIYSYRSNYYDANSGGFFAPHGDSVPRAMISYGLATGWDFPVASIFSWKRHTDNPGEYGILKSSLSLPPRHAITFSFAGFSPGEMEELLTESGIKMAVLWSPAARSQILPILDCCLTTEHYSVYLD